TWSKSTPSENGSPQPIKEQRETQLLQALKRLSEIQRQCIQLFFFEEKSYQQIADITQLPLNRVKSHLQNGKRLLKRYIEQAPE
ncbi:MAG: sigma factor-like helix-turn-helix DNA-binding protein, partial [Bacteroidota bacterium]